jgi:hypothetical protein
MIPNAAQLSAGTALVITKIQDCRSPKQYLESILGTADPADGFLHFFLANPDRVFGFSFPSDGDLGTSYGIRDASIGVTRDGIRRFLCVDPVANPCHCISLNDSSLLNLSLLVGKFCNMRFTLQEFSALISTHYKEEKGIDKLRVWLSGIDVLRGDRGAEDGPGALVHQIKSTVPFSQPEILVRFGNILGKIDNFQYLQHFLRQVLKIGSLKGEYQKVFAEGADENLAAVLNPILLTNRVELERLIQLAEAEKEKTLLEKIGYIVGHYGLDPTTSMISQRSLDISQMDIFQRHKVVTEIYEKKFLPFREFLNTEDLETIGKCVADIRVNKALPIHPNAILGPLPDFSCDWDRGGYGSTHGAWLIGGEAVANWARHWSGGMRVHRWWWNKQGSNSEGSQDNYARAFPEATKRYNAAVATYNQAKSSYDADVKRASDVEFPSATFDTLVDKVNGCLKKLIK